MVHVAEAAAEETGIDAEIIDLRTLVPLDIDTIVASVKKTGRCVIVHEATLTSGFGAELVAQVQEHCFYALEAPVKRVDRLGHALSASPRSGTISPARTGSGARSSKRWRLEMGVRSIKMPDVGEGVAEAEIVEWRSRSAISSEEDQIVAAVMTDKATVEIPTPVAGSVLALGGAVGDVLAVGAELVRIDAPGLPDSAAPTAPKSRAAATERRPRRRRASAEVCSAGTGAASRGPAGTAPERDIPALLRAPGRRRRRRVLRARSRSRRPQCA